ncbi:MAG: sigma-70 family RNA polymerase sigma factor, partial [Bacteroidota bacterium]
MTKEQFNNQVLSLQNKLFRYALSIVANRELARDVVQEVLMKCWDQRQQLDQVRQIEAWCIRLTRNKAYDKLKLRSNKTVALNFADQKRTLVANPDQRTEEKDLLAKIQLLLQELPEKQREIFRLKDLLGYSNTEIQELLDMDATQVKVYLFRARKKIRSKL